MRLALRVKVIDSPQQSGTHSVLPYLRFEGPQRLSSTPGDSQPDPRGSVKAAKLGTTYGVAARLACGPWRVDTINNINRH